MRTLAGDLREMRDRRALIAFLAARRRRSGVAGTVLGRVWHLLTPTSQIAIYYLLVVVIFGQGQSYRGGAFLTIVAGIMHFTMFSQAITGGAGAILAQERLLLQVRIEPIVFVGASYRETMTNGMLGVGVFFAFYLFSGNPGEADWGLYALALFVLAVLAWAGALAAATLTVFLRDVRLALPIGLRLLLYACPVIYPTDFVPERVQTLFFLNPVASVFGVLQHALFGTPAPPRVSLIVSGVVITSAVVAAHVLYARSEPKFTKAF